MKTVILGSGVIGVATAYFLARAGVEVLVIERQPDASLETSFANAGEVSPGLASPWAAPGVPLKAIRWLFAERPPLVIRWRRDPAQWRWLLAMLGNCTESRYRRNKERMQRLAHYSRAQLEALRVETGIQYDQRMRGTLQLFRDQSAFDGAGRDTGILTRLGIAHALLDREQCIAVEPGLGAAREKIAGGLHLPGDETGDCFKFTNALEELAVGHGARFEYGTRIESLRIDGGRIAGVMTDRGKRRGDHYVVSLGSYSPSLLAPLGIRLPVFPVKGYSVTLPIADAGAAPESTILDEAHKIAVTRLGERIRAAGTAELAGFDLGMHRDRCEAIAWVVRDLFPGGGDLARAEYWTGLRPMTPDGPPLIGPTRYPNLFLNTGHGTLGWTMSCGSGRVVADLIQGLTPEIAIGGLTVDRYARG